MRRLLMLLLGLVTAAATAQPAPDCPPQAGAPSAEQRAEAAAAPRDRGFLWRISRDGRSSWLYGTVHLARLAWTVPGSRVAAALAASDVVALELDVDDPALMQRLRAGMAAQRGFALPPELDTRLRRQLAAACLPAALFDVMSPQMVATTLVVLAGRRAGLDPAWGIDPALGRAARSLGKPVRSLETPEQQLALLHSQSADDAQESVEKIVDGLESGRALPMLQRVVQVWADSRHDELADYPAWCDCAGSERERAQMAAVLDARNPALADGIDALHRQHGRVFAAVGSLHMIGEQGLPALLAARGFTVERIAFDR